MSCLINGEGSLKKSSRSHKKTFNFEEQIVSSLSEQKIPINKAWSKTIYNESQIELSLSFLLKRKKVVILRLILLIVEINMAYHIVLP